MSESERCETCEYYTIDDLQSDEELAVGICRRFPPTLSVTDTQYHEWLNEVSEGIRATPPRFIVRHDNDFIHFVHPRVIDTDWCGEHKPKESTDRITE